MRKQNTILCVILCLMMVFSSCATPDTDSDIQDESSVLSVHNEDEIVWLISSEYLNLIDDGRITELNKLLKEKGFSKTVVFEPLSANGSTEGETKRTIDLLAKRKEKNVQTDLITPSCFFLSNESISAQNRYWALVKNEFLFPITDYLHSEAGTNLYDSFSESYWKSALIENEIYAVRHRYNSGWLAKVLSVNQTLLDNSGISLNETDAATLDSLVKLIEKVYIDGEIKDGYTDKNPLRLFPEKGYVLPGLENITKCAVVNIDDAKLKAANIFECAEVKEYLKTVYELSLTGVVNPVGVLSTDTVENFLFEYSQISSPNDMAIQEILCANGTIHLGTIALEPIHEFNLTNGFTAVSSWSQNQEAACQLLNLLTTDPDVANLLMYGIEGEDYIIKDGYPVFEIEDGSTIYFQGYEQLYIPGSLVCLPSERESTNKQADYKEWQSQVSESRLLGFWFDFEPVRAEADAMDAIFEKYLNIWSAQGIEDFDAMYDALLAELKDAGIDRLVEEANRQLAEWQKE